MASNKTAASAVDAASDSSSGKRWLRGLILRAEEVLGKMIYKLERTPITEEEIVAMANSVHPLVAKWEKPLEDIRLELLNIPGVVEADQGKPKEEQQEQESKMERSGLLALKEEEIRLITLNGGDRPAEPSFQFPEQSLADYKPNRIGRCIISSIGSGQRTFSMVDLDHPDRTKLFAAMQSMSGTRIYRLPPPGEVFGVYLEGSVLRAVRNKPRKRDPFDQDFIRLLDTGEILPYEDTLSMCSLSEYYRQIPAFAIRCVLVSVIDDPLCQNFDRYLKNSLRSNRFFKVVFSEKTALFVELSKLPILPKDDPSTIPSPESTPPKAKPLSAMRRPSSLMRSPPQQLPRVNVFAIPPASPTNPFTFINRFASVPLAAATATRPFCPFNNGSDESNCASGAHSKGDPIPPPVPTGWQQRKQIVPPIGCHLMLVPKFIRDVGHMWCWVVKAGYIDPDFHEMELRMNDPEYSLQYRKFRGKPKMNDRAFAKYTDKRWYRTEVVNYFDERNVRVFYVDYGNCEMVTMDELRHWDDRFSYLPYQVKLCKLSNLKPVKKIHPQAVIELNRKLLNKRVRAEIVNNSVPWEIIIFDEDRFDISHGLLLTGLAKKIKEDNEPDPTQEAPGA